MTDSYETLLAQLRDLNENIRATKDKVTSDRQAAEALRQGATEQTGEIE
jgi:hypothetical protein